MEVTVCYFNLSECVVVEHEVGDALAVDVALDVVHHHLRRQRARLQRPRRLVRRVLLESWLGFENIRLRVPNFPDSEQSRKVLFTVVKSRILSVFWSLKNHRTNQASHGFRDPDRVMTRPARPH